MASLRRAGGRCLLGNAGKLLEIKDAHAPVLLLRFGVDQDNRAEGAGTCASLLHSTGCSRSPERGSPPWHSPTMVSWWAYAGDSVTIAVSAARLRPAMTTLGGAGATWIWPPADCGSRPTSGGSTVASAHGSEPKTCPGLGPERGCRAISKTLSPGWRSEPTRPASAVCCGCHGRRCTRS